MTAGTLTRWLARADEALTPSLPGRWRLAIEVALLLAIVLGGRTEEATPFLAGAGILVLEATVAVILLRPWAPTYGSGLLRAFAVGLALATVTIPALVQGPAAVTRRLGVELVPYAGAAADPAPGALVKSIFTGTPADGRIRSGDRILAVDGKRLTLDDPPADLARRIQDDALAEDFAVTLVRSGEVVDVQVRVPQVTSLERRVGALSALAKDHVIVATAVRDVFLVAFILLLARVDGQPLAALGLSRERATDELAFAVPATGGVFLVQVAAAIPLSFLGGLLGFAQREAAGRVETLSRLSDQTSVPEFFVALVAAATFEEIAFRAFLTPRVRKLCGSWPVATLIVSGLFGLGHVYEGTLAVAQTAILGVYFTAVFLARRNVLAAITCHTVFNGAMFLFIRIALHSDVVGRLKALGH